MKLGRHGRGKLRQLATQIRSPHLERRQHARAVSLGQDIVDEPVALVQNHVPGCHIAPVGVRKRVQFLHQAVPVEGGPKRGAVQLFAKVPATRRYPVQVALDRRGRPQHGGEPRARARLTAAARQPVLPPWAAGPAASRSAPTAPATDSAGTRRTTRPRPPRRPPPSRPGARTRDSAYSATSAGSAIGWSSAPSTRERASQRGRRRRARARGARCRGRAAVAAATSRSSISPVVVADRERLDRTRRQPRGDRGDQSGVDPAAQEHAERHVRDHAAPNRRSPAVASSRPTSSPDRRHHRGLRAGAVTSSAAARRVAPPRSTSACTRRAAAAPP